MIAVAIAARTAGPWSVLWATGVALVAAVPSWWVCAAVAGLAGAALGVVRPGRYPVAVPSALAALVTLANLPVFQTNGLSAAVTVVALTPLMISGVTRLDRRRRRRVLIVLGLTAAAVFAVGAVAVATVAGIAPTLDAAASSARTGLDQARSGSTEQALVSFDQAAGGFEEAAAVLDRPSLVPAAFVPVLAQHVEAVRVAAGSGAALSGTAATASGIASSSPDLLRDGQVDLGWLESTAPAVRSSADALTVAETDLGSVRSPWLLGAIGEPLDDLRSEVAGAAPSARTGAELLEVAPGLLGASGPRRYLVLATNLAEARYHGGFIGGYVEIEVVDGRFDVAASGKASDLTPFLEGSDLQVGDEDYRARYGSYSPERYFMNATASPDGAVNARIAAQVYGGLTGRPVDGVVIIDAAGLAALLRLSGPVEVAGVEGPVSADNVEAFLHRDQYLEFDERNPDRSEALGNVSEAVVEALTSRTLPGPRALSDALAPAFDRGSIQFWFADPEVQEVVERTPASGRFAAEPGADLLSVRSSNLNANKIDGFATRVIDHDVEFDPGTGAVSSSVEVTVTNAAPPGGLPNYLIGVESRPPGTNRMLLTVWTGLELDGVTVDGSPVEVSTQSDRGVPTYTIRVTLPPGSTQVARFELRGRIDAGPTYRLVTYQQPAVNEDAITLSVSGSSGFTPVVPAGFSEVDGAVRGQLPPRWRTQTDVPFVPAG